MTAADHDGTAAPASRVKSSASSLTDRGYPHGHLGHLSEREEEALVRFKDFLEAKGVWKRGPPASHDDALLL